MLEVRTAKRKMEHEEGLNHLWIRLLNEPARQPGKAILQVELPEGFHRDGNLNGFCERASGEIELDLAQQQEVFIPFFTEDAIPCGEYVIVVTLAAGVEQAELFNCRLAIAAIATDGGDAEELEIDQEVIDRLAAFRLPSGDDHPNQTEFVIIAPQVLDIQDKELSQLEKQYRVDYEMNSLRKDAAQHLN
ncbi:hypothetical protein EBB07_27435 [Paenibacillaceae bacterium]|nr:hypothetical protein EBB07_27435 [Paenibacillaceae bacterium]